LLLLKCNRKSPAVPAESRAPRARRLKKEEGRKGRREGGGREGGWGEGRETNAIYTYIYRNNKMDVGVS